MRKFTILAALCALCAAAGAVSAAAGEAAANEAATITVLHGTKTETVDPAKSPPGGVLIIRPVVKPPTRTAAAEPPARTRAARRTFFAGDTLWTTDARTGRLEACFVGSSGIVGKRIIRCTGPDAFGR